MVGDEVLELSVEETNKLRVKLGLAPLRGVGAPAAPLLGKDKESLELSVEDTNKLRAELGLRPLSTSSSSKKNDPIHKPAHNQGHEAEVKDRIEQAKLTRLVQQGIAQTFGTETLGGNSDDDAGMSSWAEKMRNSDTNNNNKSTTTATQEKQTGSKKKKKKKSRAGTKDNKYDEQDLQGINVSHAVSDFDAGSTTILTLADAPLLQQDEDSKKALGLHNDDDALQNVDLADQQQQNERLREKRQVEMGMGRAGGYAGYDDDEFEELGGVMGPSRLARGAATAAAARKRKKGSKKGFMIGTNEQEDANTETNDLYGFQNGNAVSLQQEQADVIASDFMTAEEDAQLLAAKKQKKSKSKEFKKSKKKKKDKKQHRRKVELDDEDQEEQELAVKNTEPASILDELEQTAVDSSKSRKRRRDVESDDDDDNNSPDKIAEQTKRRARFDEIMEKGNKATETVFAKPQPQKPSMADDEVEADDDTFLNEALAKSRRLRKLRQMQQPKGADAVVQAVQAAAKVEQQVDGNPSSTTMTFDVDETQEFSRALLARQGQEARQKAKKKTPKIEISTTVKKEEKVVEGKESVDDVIVEDAPFNMDELAKEIKDDDLALEGTAASAPIGRGMAGIMSVLKHTGELGGGKNAGREELRGRAKDERNYENYEALDLSKVVRIGKNATDKDREFASREIKLDYRDEHGRKLTQKEAYRNLCYAFHGHGSSVKNEEKRLRQVEREQAEARLASQQASGAGSLGALRATQEATGKAFVVHKTG